MKNIVNVASKVKVSVSCTVQMPSPIHTHREQDTTQCTVYIICTVFELCGRVYITLYPIYSFLIDSGSFFDKQYLHTFPFRSRHDAVINFLLL